MPNFPAPDSKLEKIQQELEKVRLQELKAGKPTILAAIVLILSFPLGAIGLSFFIPPAIAVIISFLSLGIYIFKNSTVSSAAIIMRHKFKENLVLHVMQSINSTISYDPDKGINYKHLNNAETVILSTNRIEGEDYVYGKTQNGCSFEFAELILPTNDLYHSKRQFFFTLTTKYTLDLNQKLIIRPTEGWWEELPENQPHSFSGLINFSSWMTNSSLDKQLQVFSNTKKLVPQILTPTTIKILNHWSKEWNTLPFVTFKNNRIYILFDTHAKLFEADIYEKLTDNKVIERLHTEISSCFDLVEDFSQIEIDKNAILDNPDEENDLFDHLIDDGMDC